MAFLPICLLVFYRLTYAVIANTTTRDEAARDATTACRTFSSTLPSPNPTCWETLQMDIWISNWNVTTTQCTATQDSLDPCQCMYEEVWATCFMRLTFEENRGADYDCTDVTMPANCTKPLPGHIVQGPAEIYYGAYSIWNLNQYLSNWYTALMSVSAVPAIDTALQDPNSNTSTNALLRALMNQYGVDNTLFEYLVPLITGDLTDVGNQQAPTSASAQLALGEFLKSTLQVITSDWSSGDFMLLSGNGMLLNNTGETAEFLTTRLSQQ